MVLTNFTTTSSSIEFFLLEIWYCLAPYNADSRWKLVHEIKVARSPPTLKKIHKGVIYFTHNMDADEDEMCMVDVNNVKLTKLFGGIQHLQDENLCDGYFDRGTGKFAFFQKDPYNYEIFDEKYRSHLEKIRDLIEDYKNQLDSNREIKGAHDKTISFNVEQINDGGLWLIRLAPSNGPFVWKVYDSKR